MPRVYVSKTLKPYKKYDPLILKNAVAAYETGNKSLVDIAKHFNISKSVLHRHVTRIMKCHGGQKCLNEEAEKYIIRYINVCSEWGYPLDTYDLRVIIKGYLDRVGIEVKKFNNNLPGIGYVESFLKRYNKEISERITQNIKRSRAEVSPKIIEDYFGELQKSIEGVPLTNIVNYDETNLADDPGRRKVLTKRGVKYPERVMNHTKSSTSLMMAASADGTLLPCYVVYKATHLYNTWTTNGPPNCRYNRTSSGWFDGNTFEDWVETIALPYFSNKIGKKILIGDNLSSHLSLNIIKKCQELNVNFVFLPPNSTHLTQPLDIAFFRPMKIAWRDILFTWKKTEGRVLPTIPKNNFPQLLKKLIQKMEPNLKQNILAGFLKSGINPLNKDKVLKRLPGYDSTDEFSTEEKEAIDESVLTLLKEMRYTQKTRTIKKMKKLNVLPGKSVEDSDISSEVGSDSKTSSIECTVTQGQTKGKGVGKKSKKQKCSKRAEKPIVNIQENIIFDTIDVDKMPIVLDEDILVTEEITIHPKIISLFNEKPDESIIPHYDDLLLKDNDNIISCARQDNLYEKTFSIDVQQEEVTQLQVNKPFSKKKIPEGKRIQILSDEKIIYKGNTKRSLELKPRCHSKASDYKINNDALEPKPSSSGFRRPSYYKNDMDILRDLMDPKDFE